MSHYIATKMGIIGFMRGLANDVASDGITANAVLPGLTNTLATARQSEEQERSTWEQQAITALDLRDRASPFRMREKLLRRVARIIRHASSSS